MATQKYKSYPVLSLPDRKWPSQVIARPPLWCTVDLRDGNQALIEPMSVENKLEMYRLLVDIGFKEIEVGFPSASKIEFNFLRLLVDKNLIPDDVIIQVLTQARGHLIERTFESLQGVKQAIVHLYNSTSELQRRVVFSMNRKEVIKLAVNGARMIRNGAERMKNCKISYEYSPESFTGTELDFALDICEAVMDVWQPSPVHKMIINLPATIEMATPNVYADQIEWFGRTIKTRESIILSVHPHNDRGTAVAAAELALMAGAERVEGTLFGNGERTGNVDLVTLALNLFSQGIDPGLDLSDVNKVREIFERCTNMAVHMRHPYVGELVYTAFSGSHQDAINKGMKQYYDKRPPYWEVPYLPIDPSDVGRTYESIIRINSQSGKGGVAYVMEKEHGYILPKAMHPEFGRIIQSVSDSRGSELSVATLMEIFEKEYLHPEGPYVLRSCRITENEGACSQGSTTSRIKAVISADGVEITITGSGNGPVDAFSNALRQGLAVDFDFLNYSEHALSKGSDSQAVAYVQLEDSGGRGLWGVGIDTNIDVASLKAILSALNKLAAKGSQ
jgi:2-isopropylmalate synthase